MLTPYQFASNRPIDGIDIDGKEYGSINIVVFPNGHTSNEYTPYDATQLNVCGPKGRGLDITVTVLYKDGQNGRIDNYWWPRNATRFNGAVPTEYGNYMGATSFYKVNASGDFMNGLGKTKLEYFYGVPAVDAVDEAAKKHDIGYDNLQAVGESGLFDDWGTTPVDENALNTWNGILRKYKTGDKDPVTGQKITSDELGAAKNASILFAYTTSQKKGFIADFMYDNFPAEAASLSIFSSNTWSSEKYKKAIEYNYQLFLKKYLTKDKHGNWTRNLKMWHQEADKSWKPNKTK